MVVVSGTKPIESTATIGLLILHCVRVSYFIEIM